MVYRILSVLVLLTVQSLAVPNFRNKDYNEWTRQIGTSSTGQDGVCKIDLLILLDISNSITESVFDNQIKGFLRKLVANDKLSVGPDHTNIAMIRFSNTENTEPLFKFGEKPRQTDLEDYFTGNEFTWNGLSGDRTRTGLAFHIANTNENFFTKQNPGNARENIPDVVMIITDGEPRGPGDAGEETARAFAEAEALRDKQVLIIGVAIGPDRNKFKNNIVRMTGSEENTFNATTDGLETILDKLVEASCNNAPACSLKCSDTEGVFFTNKHNEGIYVLIPPPVPVQESNDDGVCPQVPPPKGKGQPGGTLPTPPFPPALPTVPGAVYQFYGVGEHTSVLTYLYNDVEVTCSTKIIVKVKCGETTYDPDLKTCCCGKLWRKQRVGEKCCGNQLIDTRAYSCCDEKIASFVSHSPDGCYYPS